MTRNEFLSSAAIQYAVVTNCKPADAWKYAEELAHAAPVSVFTQSAPQASSSSASKPSGSSVGGFTFPNYGKSKGAPVSGASENDLRFYARGCLRTLSDPDKARFHDKERPLLNAIVNELRSKGWDADEFDLAGAMRATAAAERAQESGPGVSADDIPF